MEVWNGLGLSGATRDDPITVIQHATYLSETFDQLYTVSPLVSNLSHSL
jgi:hypothetical protein